MRNDESDRNPASEPLEFAASPYLTTDLPGIGGVIKQSPEDFEVEEIPAYQPSGEGEHLFLWIEKRGVAAEQLTRHIARALSISNREIGTAGLKDRQALTRQYVSVPSGCEPRIGELETDAIHVLSFARHGNKLRSGHLHGNRFSILVRDVCQDARERAERVAERIALRGFPNYYGSQRFGHAGENVRTGFELLSGCKTQYDIPRSRRRFLLRMSLSAAQSQLFNLALAQRLNDSLTSRVLKGDVMQVVASGGTFAVDDETVEQQRCDAGETVVTGPMFGPKMIQPTGEPAAREARLLAAQQIQEQEFSRYSKLTRGTRRAYLVMPGELSLQSEPDGLRFRFSLISGAYATTLLREFCKN